MTTSKNVTRGKGKPPPPRADKATRAAAKRRRNELYDFWLRGINPTAVSNRTGVPISTVKVDFAKFAKEAADNADADDKRAHVEAWLSKTIEQADDTYNDAAGDDAKGRSAALGAKLKGIELYAKINGLMVDKVEHSGEIKASDPRFADVTPDELKAVIALAVADIGKKPGK